MDIAEQLKRIADALEAQNALHREIFEHSKQIRAEEIAQQAVEYELSHQSGPTRDHTPMMASIAQSLRERGMPLDYYPE